MDERMAFEARTAGEDIARYWVTRGDLNKVNPRRTLIYRRRSHWLNAEIGGLTCRNKCFEFHASASHNEPN